jgi:hypothetical protein
VLALVCSADHLAVYGLPQQYGVVYTTTANTTIAARLSAGIAMPRAAGAKPTGTI